MIRLLRPGRFASIFLLLPLSLAACGDSIPESEKIARSFVEAYYVRANLDAAARMTRGLAREKIKRQTKLRKDAALGGTGPGSPGLSKQRNVEYEVLEVRERGGGRVFRIGLAISSIPVSIKLQTLITVGQKDKDGRGRWVVLNFMELSGSGKPESAK